MRERRLQIPLIAARAAPNPLRFLLLLLPLALLAAFAGSVNGEPMRLDDTTPRWVSVRFEVSPSDRPELLDQIYGPPFRAWLEPAGDETIRVRVDGTVLERNLFRDRNPLPGSFSDYVWLFDARTGDVLSASFSGTLIHELSWGLGTTAIEARVEARMATTQPGGFHDPRLVWGRRLHGFCDDRSSSACTLVSPRELDGRSGYVNAVGFVRIDSRFLDFSTFSALGEARFSEWGSPAQVAERQPEAGSGRAAPAREGPPADSVSGSTFSSSPLRDVAAPPPLH